MSDKVRTLVSVIVPIYNTQEFLPRCLDSILNQSYINMEIILVNDGSTDDSVSICERFAGRDARIQLISQPNQGIIAAKRAGIKLCHGAYVMFVDSDDWIEPKLLETMVQAIEDCNCSLVCTNVYMDSENATFEKRNAIPFGTYETARIAKDLFYYEDTDSYGVLPYSVAKLYSRDMLEEVLDNISTDVHYAEDKAIVFSFVFKNIRVCFLDAMYYHYCLRNGSICQSENQNHLVELTAFYKYTKKLFEVHEEREYLLWQLGKYLLQETSYAISGKLGLNTIGKPFYTEPYRLDPSVFFLQNRKIILYGAGKVGTDYWKQMADCMNIELCGWVDKDYGKYQEKGFDVQPVEYIKEIEYDNILVAVRKQMIFQKIKKELTCMGIAEDSIIWGRPYDAPYEKGRILDIDDLSELKDHKLVIYGAGQYGSFVYSFLELKGLAENVVCFAVTDCSNNPETFCGKPVECIDRIGELLKDCIVILALVKRASNEVLNILQNCVVKGICRVNGQVIEDIRKELIEGYKKLPLQQNKIILSSYDGMGYRCNSKYIAEKLLQDKAPVELVWLVSDNNICDLPEGITKVVINSPQFYKEVLTAKVYITNTVHLFYEHKREGQFFINTWHGYGPFKLAEGDVNKDAASRERYTKSNGASDLFITASSFYTHIYRRSFYYQGEVLECGAPRNDVFFKANDFGEKIREIYQIPREKGIVLYAPTYRSFTGDALERYNLHWERILESLQERFGKEYVVVYKLHHYMHKLVSEKGLYEGAVDATFYPDIQELLVAADIVITDYSSLMWDFSLQRRPVFLYQNDEDEYTNNRGFYAPVSEWPYPKAHSQEELVEQILCFDEDKYITELNAFFKKYGSCDDGHASERVAERILEVIGV